MSFKICRRPHQECMHRTGIQCHQWMYGHCAVHASVWPVDPGTPDPTGSAPRPHLCEVGDCAIPVDLDPDLPDPTGSAPRPHYLSEVGDCGILVEGDCHFARLPPSQVLSHIILQAGGREGEVRAGRCESAWGPGEGRAGRCESAWGPGGGRAGRCESAPPTAVRMVCWGTRLWFG